MAHETAWWLVGRSWLGQPAIGIPTLAWTHRGELHAVGPRGRTVFRGPVDRLHLEITSLGNLRIRGGESRLTLVPADSRGTPIANRTMRHLPAEVAASPGAPEASGDPLTRQFLAGLSKDASAPTRRIAEALIAQGATLDRSRPYSRARVLAVAVGVLALLIVLIVGTALLFS